MCLELINLPTDTLVLLCQRILLGGEAYWLATTCRAFQKAMAAACAHLKLPLSSIAATACLTLRRLEIAMTLEPFQELVHANMKAAGCEARPRSLDLKWVWSPTGERVLAARAPPEVLDYAWAGWRLSTEPPNPGCFVVVAAAAGRVDLLREMDQSAVAQKLSPSLEARTLRARLTTSPDRLEEDARLDWVERALLMPALRSGDTGAIRWYYERMDRLCSGEACPVAMTEWRVALSRETGYNGTPRICALGRAAATGDDPYTALEFLHTWMWPRLGSRAPSTSMVTVVHIASAALLCAIDSTRGEAVGVWAWLKHAVPQGASDLFYAMSVVANVHVVPLYQQVWIARSAGVYEWISAQLCAPCGWMWTLFGTHAKFPGVSNRLRFAHMTLHNIFTRCEGEGAVDPEVAWNLDRDMFVKALSDALVWSTPEADWEADWEADPGAVAYATGLIKRDAAAFVTMAVTTVVRCARVSEALRVRMASLLASVVGARRAEEGTAPLAHAQCAELHHAGVTA
jgi:hypothetical protein